MRIDGLVLERQIESWVRVLVFANEISIRISYAWVFPLQLGEVLALEVSQTFLFLSLLFDSSLMMLNCTY